MAVQFSSMISPYPAVRASARPIISRTIPNRTTGASTDAPNPPAASSGNATSAPSTAAAGASSTTGNNSSSAVNSLFPVNTATLPATTAPADPVPTAQSVFGASPWLANPTGTGPTGTYTYNPYYFATPQTAATVASMVGGKVVSMNAVSSGGRFVQDQPNEMVQLPNGALINPGLVASFYTHGYPQSMINQMIASEVANVSEGN